MRKFDMTPREIEFFNRMQELLQEFDAGVWSTYAMASGNKDLTVSIDGCAFQVSSNLAETCQIVLEHANVLKIEGKQNE